MLLHGTPRIVSTKQFPLNGTQERFWHLATITAGVKEFMYFLDTQSGLTYIEEITGGHLEKIDDDNLWNDLAKLLQDNLVTIAGVKQR